MKYFFIGFILIYQKLISPLLPKTCRFYPTCSHYGIEAFRQHGLFYGMYLTVKRVLKCNPFFEGGNDPVPGKKSGNLKSFQI